jgi:hypothetical protein
MSNGMRDGVGNASDRAQTKKAGKRDRLRERDRIIAMQNVMQSVDGRKTIWWILKQCGVTQSVMRGGHQMSSYFAGKQDAGHMLQAEILKIAPDNYLLMQREAIEEQKQTQKEEPEPVDPDTEVVTESLGDPEE